MNAELINQSIIFRDGLGGERVISFNVRIHSSNNVRKRASRICSTLNETRSGADLAAIVLAQDVVTEKGTRERFQRDYLSKYPNYNVSLFLFIPLDIL
jgi:hypothetical protein